MASAVSDPSATPPATTTSATHPARGHGALLERVDRAIARARAAVLAQQGADGSWHGVNDGGPFGTAWTLVFERYLGALSERDAREGVRYLRAQQLADGSAPNWPGATRGTLDGALQWYAGMWAGGVPASDAAMARARAWIDAHGGFDAGLITSRVVLAVAGAMEPSRLPRVPLFYKLLPGNLRVLARLLGVDWVIAAHLLPGLIRGLQNGGRAPRPLREPVLALEYRALIEYVSARQDASGGWIGVAFESLIVAGMLRALGVPRDDPRITRALAYAAQAKVYRDDGLFVGVFRSDVWDTAQYVRALVQTGVAATDPAIARAVRYLLDNQVTRTPPWDWQLPPPGAPTIGGWPFEPGNAMNPDLDSSQEVLSALVLARDGGLHAPAVEGAIRRGEAFLLGMQNPDGGWAAFQYGKPAMKPGAMFVPARTPPGGYDWLGKVTAFVDKVSSTLIEFGDASTSDVSARMIWTLRLLGHTPDEPVLQRALALIEYQRDPGTAVWWGMWAVCFIPTTCYVLGALAAMGRGPDDPVVARAAEWILGRQNADGGWGETVDVFGDLSLAGVGPSSRAVSAYAVWGLALAGRAHTEGCARGVQYLLEQQGEDGSWADTAPVGTLLPGAGYYTNSTFATYFALEALHAYRRAPGLSSG